MNYPLPVPTNRMNKADSAALEAAVAALEKTSFAKKLAHLAGRQIGFAGRIMPAKLQQVSAIAARRALFGAMNFALASLKGKPVADTRRRHQRLAMVSGAVGGALGLASLPVELPISTTIMLRAIADIARAEGEDLSDPAAAMACLEVFALGGHGEDEKVMEGGYLALRGLFAKSVSDAAAYVAKSGVSSEVGARPRPLDRNDLGAFWRRRLAKDGGASRARYRRDQWRRDQSRFHRTLPNARARTFHRAAAGAGIWTARSAGRIRAHRPRGRLLAGGSRGSGLSRLSPTPAPLPANCRSVWFR